MNITPMPIEDISAYPNNAKKHPESQIKQIAESIREFGFNQPIVVDAKNVIIVGHGRYEAAKLTRLRMVPVIKIDLDEARARAYRIADNKLADSEWDMPRLIADMESLGIDLQSLTGFKLDELKVDMREPDDEQKDAKTSDGFTVVLHIPHDKYDSAKVRIDEICDEFGIKADIS